MKCSNCGGEMTPVDGHCSICGSPILQVIDYEHVEETNTGKDIISENGFNQEDGNKSRKDLEDAKENIIWQVDKELTRIQNEKSAASKKKKGKKLIFGMFVLCFALVIIFNLGNKNSDNKIPVLGDGSDDSSSVGTGVYQSTATKLLQVDGVIYNNVGDSLEGLFKDDKYSYHFSYDKSMATGVFVDNRDTALYVTSDLKTIPIESNAVKAEISFDGNYAYYITEVEYDDFLYIYDIKSGTKYKIDEDVASYVALSPDGTKITYMKYNSDYSKRDLYVAGIDMQPQMIASDVNGIRAVSNDGETVFYKVYDEEYKTHEYAWHNGETIVLSDNFPSYFCFNNDCTKVIFKDRDHNYYYSSGMSNPLIFEDISFYNIAYDVPRREVSEYEYDSVIYDDDDFRGAIITTYDNGILMIEDETSTISIGQNNYGLGAHARRDGEDIYIVGEDKNIVRKVMDSEGNITSTVLASDIRANELVTNDDASVIWFIAYESGVYKLYQVDETDEMSVIMEDKDIKGYRSIKWDSDTCRLYVLCDDYCLYSMTLDGEIEEISSCCKYLHDENYNYPGTITYEDTYGKEYISVFGRFILLQD